MLQLLEVQLDLQRGPTITTIATRASNVVGIKYDDIGVVDIADVQQIAKTQYHTSLSHWMVLTRG